MKRNNCKENSSVKHSQSREDLFSSRVGQTIDRNRDELQQSPMRKFTKSILQYKHQISNMREYLINLEKGKFTPKNSVLSLHLLTKQSPERKSEKNITFANNSPSHRTCSSLRKSLSERSIACRSDRSKSVVDEAPI